MVRGDRPGDGTIQLSLQGADDITNSTFTVRVTSIGEPVGTSGETLPLIGVFAGVFVIILLAGGAFLLQRQKPQNNPQMAPLHQFSSATVKPVPTLSTPEPASTGPMCWSCRTTISGPMLGCPGCGARYHRSGQQNCSADELQQCLNCSTPSSSFVEA